MTFVQSGMPPRLPAHDQSMISHDISAETTDVEEAEVERIY